MADEKFTMNDIDQLKATTQQLIDELKWCSIAKVIQERKENGGVLSTDTNTARNRKSYLKTRLQLLQSCNSEYALQCVLNKYTLN